MFDDQSWLGLDIRLRKRRKKFFLIWELEIGMKVKLVFLALALAFVCFVIFRVFKLAKVIMIIYFISA